MVNNFKIMFTKQEKYDKNKLIGILGARKEENLWPEYQGKI